MRRIAILTVALGLALTACENNIGRAFDPDVGGGGGGSDPTDGSNVQVVPVGGDAREGRPRVRGAFPEGAGWPQSVPIVVEFSESMNEESILPSTPQGTDARVWVEPQGSGQPLPALYDFVQSGRVLIIRPLSLEGTEGLPFDIVIDPEARDSDGIRFGGSEPSVLASFSADQDPSFADGEIVAVIPSDNEDDVPADSDVFVILNRAPLPNSVTSSTLQVAPVGGSAVAGDLLFPVDDALGNDDPRIVQLDPTSDLATSTRFELTVTSGIRFPNDGDLDFRGRTPFSEFDTLAFLAPTAIAVGNPTSGFADKINRANLETLTLDVTVPATAAAGDRLVCRVYGLDADTAVTDDVNFVERTASVPANGSQTVTVDMTGTLQTVANPRFSDGSVRFAAQLQRGDRHSGFALSADSQDARLDVTPPTMVAVGAPGQEGTNDVFAELNAISFYGVASEELGAAELTDGTTTVNLFASAPGGRFVMNPLSLGIRTTSLGYSINFTDAAGNMGAAAVQGNIVPRGVVAGPVGTSLTVEAYDSTTLLPIEGATVLVDPGVPSVPASGQLTRTTNGNGRAVFSVSGSSFTTTILADGYDVVTLYNSTASFASLPLEPTTGNTATLSGNLVFTAPQGGTARVSSNLLADPAALEVATTIAAPTDVPDTAIRPGRAQVLTAFGGVFEPSSQPGFTFFACAMCGADALTATPPAAPADAGQNRPQNLILLPAELNVSAIPVLTSYSLDLSTAAGFDEGNLASDPFSRVTASLSGFHGQNLIGVGFATLSSGTTYDVGGTFALAPVTFFTPYLPVTWTVTQAEDTSGAVIRHRGLLTTTSQTVLNVLALPDVPTVAAGTFTTAPNLAYEDGLDRSAIIGGGGQAVHRFVATDTAGRRWEVLVEDTDVAIGSTTVQFPDVSASTTTGLVTGAWTVVGEAWLYIDTFGGIGNYLLEERLRQEATYARSPSVTVTVN